MTFWLIVGLASAGAWMWMVRDRKRRSGYAVEDPDALEAAEREVRDLGADATPDDARDLPDWGPGTPRH